MAPIVQEEYGGTYRVQEGGDGAYSLGRIWWHLEFRKEMHGDGGA